MTVRAKFRVDSVNRLSWERGKTNAAVVVMSPVYSNDPNSENKAFWEATPNGKIEMTINNLAAFDQFQPGDSFYVDFTKADL